LYLRWPERGRRTNLDIHIRIAETGVMKISALEEYGLRCLMQVARSGVEDPQPISGIAAREGLSAEYVGKLLMKLRQGGLVESFRGKAGGYVLARPAGRITLRNVLETLSEPIYEPGHCSKFSGIGEVCVHVEDCGIRPVWAEVNRFLAEALDRVTLKDLLTNEAEARELLLRSLKAQAETDPAPGTLLSPSR
jgi:Rrf2 family protein